MGMGVDHTKLGKKAKRTPTRSFRAETLVALGLIGSLISLAMWGKMRFVTDLPRIAYADPKGEKITGDNASCASCSEKNAEQTSDPKGESPDPERLDRTGPQTGEF